MNNLSIILYFIDVLGNIQGLFGVTAGFGVFGTLFLVVFWVSESRRYGNEISRPFHGSIPVLAVLTVVTLALIAVCIPSRTTMQMIAVSEASEMVIMNEEVREVMSDVKDVLKTQLNKLKE